MLVKPNILVFDNVEEAVEYFGKTMDDYDYEDDIEILLMVLHDADGQYAIAVNTYDQITIFDFTEVVQLTTETKYNANISSIYW